MSTYKKNEKNIVMKIGSQANLIGTAVLKDGTKSSNVAWGSSDNTIAIVNDGKISANKLGITTVLATSVLDSNYKGLINIEVVDDANFATSDRQSINNVKTVSINTLGDHGSKFEWFNTGDSVKSQSGVNISAVATVTLSDNTKNSNVIWESSDNNIASVDDKGNIRTKSTGTTTIVAKYRLNPDFKGLINISVENTSVNNNVSSSSQITSDVPLSGPVIFEEGFENGLDKWLTETKNFMCESRGDFGKPKREDTLSESAFTWENQIFFRVKSGSAKEGNKYLVSTNSEGTISSNSNVLFNILKTKEVIDFSSAKSPKFQLYLKSTAIPSESVKFMIYISSKANLIGGDPTGTGSCHFNTTYDDISDRPSEFVSTSSYYYHYGILDLDYKVTPTFSIEGKDWVKKDFDLSGMKVKAGYLVIAVSIKDNITKFDGPMIDAIRIYDAG